MRILWIGEIVLDKTYTISNDIKKWYKQQSIDSITSIGWTVPTALKFLKNMWCDVTIVWSVWSDPIAEYMKNQLESYWIMPYLIYDSSTKINTVFVDEKTWTRTIIKDAIKNKQIVEIPIWLVKEADFIIFDRTEPLVFDYILKHKRPDAKILVDPSNEFTGKTIHMMKNSDAYIFPIEIMENFWENYDLKNHAKVLYEIFWDIIIITDWWNWVHIFDWEYFENVDALSVEVIDTNWAWDVFRWAYAWGLLNNWENKKIIEFANKMAWLQCTKKWNMQAVPNKKEIQSIS